MRADQVALLGSLAWRFPALRPALDEHLSDNEGEILPHVLMGDYEQWCEGAVGDDDATLADVLAALEDAYATGGDEVENLISVSFLEELPEPGEPGSELRERVGPTLAKQLDAIG